MKELKLFEAFAGIGAQKKAITNILKYTKYNDINITSSGISEWFINANKGYCKIHHNNIEIFDKDLTIKEISDYLKSLGLSKDSKNPLSENDLDKMSENEKRYLYNIMKTNKNFGSVKNLTWNNFPKSDILTYSFPCTDLSVIGKQNGMTKGDNTRSGLLWEIERLLLEINDNNKIDLPKYLLMENVTMILSKKFKPEFDVFCNMLESLGYKNTILNLNSIDFNIPQSRKRIFMISELNGSEPFNIKPSTKNYEELNVGNFLNIQNMDLNNQEYMSAILKDTPIRRKMAMGKNYENSHSTKILYPFEKTFTITTKQDRLPNSGIVPFNNNKDGYLPYRFLTPRECMLLMGFDNKDFENIKKELSNTTIYLFAGNSIVVTVLEAIFKEILNRFDSK